MLACSVSTREDEDGAGASESAGSGEGTDAAEATGADGPAPTSDASVADSGSSATTAVGGESGSETESGGDEGTQDGPRPTPGCGLEPGDVLSGTIQVGSNERTYVLVLPDDYDPETPYPLVFGFHGAFDSGAGARIGYRLEEHWDGEAIVVYPDALYNAGIGGNSWVFSPGGIDFAFVLALYEAIGLELCFDQDRAFAFGFSAGGYMSNALGCFRSDLFRGIGAIAGGPPGSCDGSVAAFLGHGESDDTVPISQGIGARNLWARQNGCSDETAPLSREGCVEYLDCEEGYPVVWCTYSAGHSFFGWTAEDAVALFREL